MSYGSILATIAPVFLIILGGMVSRRVGWFRAEADASLMRVTIYLLYPALAFRFILGSEALRQPGNLVAAPLTGLLTVCLGYALAWLLAPLFGIRSGSSRGTFSFTNGIYNYGYIPIPIIAALYPADGTTGVLLYHNLGVEIAFWTIGLVIVTGSLSREGIKRLFNPPACAMVIAVVLNLSGLAQFIPGFINTAIAWAAACAIPVGLFLSGATITDLLRQGLSIKEWRVPTGAIVIRLLLLPVCFLLLARYADFLPVELRRVIVVQAAMPAGLFPIVVTRHFGGDSRVAIQVVLTTTAISLLTIPFWIAFGLRFTGLD